MPLWNKIKIYFIIKYDFPIGQFYKFNIKINANDANFIMFQSSSYSTNLPIKQGSRLICSTDTTYMIISCRNIGDVKKDILYWFGVVFSLTATTPTAGSGPAPASNFG